MKAIFMGLVTIIEDACGVRPPPPRVEICELRLDLHLGGVRGMQGVLTAFGSLSERGVWMWHLQATILHFVSKKLTQRLQESNSGGLWR